MNNLDAKPLKDAIKSHYDSKQLSPIQLSQLHELQVSQKNQNPEAPSSAIFERLIGYFTPGYQVALGMSTVAVLATLLIVSTVSQQQITDQEVMAEIAYNHSRGMSVEIASPSLHEIGAFLTSLNFTLTQSARFGSNDWTLIGGRYCSINGKLAAQLKMRRHADNKIYTLYQATLPPEITLTSAPTPASHVDGVQVTIWEENGLLLGLAGSQRSTAVVVDGPS